MTVNHATTGWVKGKAVVSLSGVGAAGVNVLGTSTPTLGQGDVNATVTITNR